MQWEEHLPSVLGNHPWGGFFELFLGLFALCPHRALLAALPQLPGKPGTKTLPAPNPLNLETRHNIPFPKVYATCPVFSQAEPLRCSEQGSAALQRYVSFLVYCPPSLMTHSGRDLFVVTVTPTSVNKASLPSPQSRSCRWQGLSSSSTNSLRMPRSDSQIHPPWGPSLSQRTRGLFLHYQKSASRASSSAERSLHSNS